MNDDLNTKVEIDLINNEHCEIGLDTDNCAQIKNDQNHEQISVLIGTPLFCATTNYIMVQGIITSGII